MEKSTPRKSKEINDAELLMPDGAWGHSLEQQKRYKDLFHCYEQALEVFPDNEEVLNNLGAHLFRTIHTVLPKQYWKFTKNITVTFKAVDLGLKPSFLWDLFTLDIDMFVALVDALRNAQLLGLNVVVFAIANEIFLVNKKFLVQSIVSSQKPLVNVSDSLSEPNFLESESSTLEISEHIREVLSNESNETLIEISVKSTWCVPMVSLVVTETMDSGLLGEHVLQTLADAWTRLLLPPCPGLSTARSGRPSSFTSQQNYGIVIPFGASIWVAALESNHLLRSISVPAHVVASIGLDSSSTIVAHRGEPYDSEDFTKLPDSARMLTTPRDVIYINFNDPLDINDCLLGKKEVSANLESVETGRVDALMAWFSLRLDEDILLSSSPGQGSCWEQAIFPLPSPLEVSAGQELHVALSCKDGKLSVSLESQSLQSQTLMSDTSVAFLNNGPWMEALTEIPEQLKHRKELHILDLSPFPVLGLQLVTRGSASKLSCSVQMEVDQKLVRLAASSVQLEFLSEEDVFSLTQKFDVIILHPVCKSGELDQSAVLQLPALRECLTSDGILLPEKVSVWAQLISSDSLSKMSKVETDLNVGDYKIADFINAYQVSQHCGLYLSTLDLTAHSEPICLLELFPREMKAVSERHVTVAIHTSGEANAIPYWFELTWSKGNTVSTANLSSHLCQAAMLLDPPHEAAIEVSVTARQQHGFLHFAVSNP
ncbi:hypothetical protein B566_EDAN011895 [Ephemera danica]|nr:hypothetical protein B566_EDAN011895 [Ephemera danica]